MKILIIWMNKINDSDCFGGVEKYTKNLIDLFLTKGYEIDFLYLNNVEKGNGYLKEKVNYIKAKRKISNYEMKLPKNKILNVVMSCFHISLWQANINKDKKLMDKYIKKNKLKYFLIVNNIPFYFSKNTRNSDNVILIQHTNYGLYDRFYFYNALNYGKYSLLYKSILVILNKAIFINKNVLKKTKNVVFFSDDKKYLKLNKRALVGSIPLELDFFQKEIYWYLNRKNNNSILYFGRFDNSSKNLNLLSVIATESNLNIDLYGHGEYEKELKANPLLNLKGKIESIDEKIKILSKYSIFLLTSNYEGMPIASIELLSMGVIGIIRNSFLEAKKIIPKMYHDLLLVNKNYDHNEYINKIKIINNMSLTEKNKIRLDLINHIRKNFSKEIFEKNWNKILKIVTNNKSI